jgi:hypothetical protein
MAQSASQRLAWEQTWSNARTWEELLDLNRRYLNGDLDISANCTHPVDTETHRLVAGLLRLTEFGVLTTSSQPEIRAGEPRYLSPETLREYSLWESGPLPKDQLVYLQTQLHRIKTEFSHEQLNNNDMAVLLSVRAREQEHRNMLTLYAANEILDSGNPGTWNVVLLYEHHIELAVEEVAKYDQTMSLCWKQYRQRQYLHFLLPTIHPKIPLHGVIRFMKRLRDHEDIVVAFQYEMSGEGPKRQPPTNRIQDPAALELFGRFTTTVPLRSGDKPFWWPVTEKREATSSDALLNTEWRPCTHLGDDNHEHIQGMLWGHFNNEAYPAGVAADPVAVLVGLKEWESNIDLLALLAGILQEEGF